MNIITLNAKIEADHIGVAEKMRVSSTVLTMNTKLGRRCDLMVSYCQADGMCRREYAGPILAGPFAATFALGVMLSDSKQESVEKIEVQDGDILEMDGILWQIRDDVRNDYPRLYPVGI